ncbi:hypothetical protein [Changpingibacter yushuensis]|uniref:hypothetical protein n=1 Tax=Changpingibacter yushuensis TaxID=2758440 RepID=UPI0015F38C2E|nr:hypothetical protein [Changpingibacter yushuensis]
MKRFLFPIPFWGWIIPAVAWTFGTYYLPGAWSALAFSSWLAMPTLGTLALSESARTQWGLWLGLWLVTPLLQPVFTVPWIGLGWAFIMGRSSWVKQS